MHDAACTCFLSSLADRFSGTLHCSGEISTRCCNQLLHKLLLGLLLLLLVLGLRVHHGHCCCLCSIGRHGRDARWAHRGCWCDRVDLYAHASTEQLLQPIDNVLAKRGGLQDFIIAAHAAQQALTLALITHLWQNTNHTTPPINNLET